MFEVERRELATPELKGAANRELGENEPRGVATRLLLYNAC
jgi:hypothetical protein